MLFDSPIYLLSLLLLVPIYWWLPDRGRSNLLLGFSYVFYAWWDWRFLWLILLSTVADYYFAKAIAASNETTTRNRVLGISVAMNLLFLGYFKYFNFFIDSAHHLLTQLGFGVDRVVLDILLPPGISFYTFQAIAYMVDVHQKRIKAVESLRDYALFIALFPHLIAGPIQRPGHLIPQVLTPRRFELEKFNQGIMLIVSGLFRKCVIADQCALIANAAFDGTFGERNAWVTLLGMYAFAWQIYGDFSGYSNIARGSAQLLGYHFMVNFRQPYLSTSLQDFWRRWHISLSSWLRDYLYIGLGGNRHGTLMTYRNLFLTMLIGGFWHGANWTFVIWGALHGTWLAIERWLGWADSEGRSGLAMRWVRRLFIFHIVCISWVFFRATDASSAFAMLAGLANWQAAPIPMAAWYLVAVFPITLFLVDWFERTRDEETVAERAPVWVQALVVGAMALATVFISAPETSAFIYFQF